MIAAYVLGVSAVLLLRPLRALARPLLSWLASSSSLGCFNVFTFYCGFSAVCPVFCLVLSAGILLWLWLCLWLHS